MNYIGGSWAALEATLRNFLRPVVTESRPSKPARPPESRSERYRASFALTTDEHAQGTCIGCKMCENICPSGVITVTAGPKIESKATGKKRGSAADFVLDLQGCIFCEMCVQVCPEDSIVMRRVQQAPTYSREGLVLTMERLYANEKALPATWGNGTVLREAQEPKRGEAPPAPAAEAAPKAAAPVAEATPKAAPDAPTGGTT